MKHAALSLLIEPNVAQDLAIEVGHGSEDAAVDDESVPCR